MAYWIFVHIISRSGRISTSPNMQKISRTTIRHISKKVAAHYRCRKLQQAVVHGCSKFSLDKKVGNSIVLNTAVLAKTFMAHQTGSEPREWAKNQYVGPTVVRTWEATQRSPVDQYWVVVPNDQCSLKTFMIHRTFVWWALYVYSIQICESSHRTFGPSHWKCAMRPMIFMNTEYLNSDKCSVGKKRRDISDG